MSRVFISASARVLACVMALLLLWAFGFALFAAQVPRMRANDSTPTDAIVVLTGGKGRIEYGLRLLAEGHASRLFISGVEDGITPGRLIALHHQVDLKPDENAVIMLGYSARNTIGNAMETAQWMRREKLHSLRLVTASYHMPRALMEFRFTMPEVRVVPDPVLPEDFNPDRWWMPGSASSQLLLSEYHKMIAAELRHWLLRATGDVE